MHAMNKVGHEWHHQIPALDTVQGLTRHSLLRMLRAQSAMVSVYKEHVVCPQTWGLARWVFIFLYRL